MNRELLLRALIAAALLAVGAWVLHHTEWVDTQVPTPARGEALRNPHYAAQRLLRELGGDVTQRQDLSALPPPQGRLMLSGQHWDLFAGRAEGLQAWVRAGGHLVIPGTLVSHDALEDWLPVVSAERPPPPKAPATAEDRPAPRRLRPGAPDADPNADCRPVVEPNSVPARYAGGRHFNECVWMSSRQYLPAPNAEGPPLWRVDGQRGTEILRMPHGQGSVTVIGNVWMLQNGYVLRGDNPLLVAGALQAAPGASFWFVAEESRPGLLSWLWTHGWVALVLGLLALALAVWRAAVRLGPVLPRASVHRRSMAEQVRGTGRFLRTHGGHALHAAQLRALHESAAPRLPQYAALGDATRAAAVARATALDADALALAMQPRTRSPQALAVDLGLLERARRRLRERPHAFTDF